jgi:hypothetical protein
MPVDESCQGAQLTAARKAGDLLALTPDPRPPTPIIMPFPGHSTLKSGSAPSEGAPPMTRCDFGAIGSSSGRKSSIKAVLPLA